MAGGSCSESLHIQQGSKFPSTSLRNDEPLIDVSCQSADNLRICHLNIRSLRNKVDEFELLLESLDFPEIVCISELNYKNCEISALKLERYKLSDYYCRANHNLGGVGIFVKNEIDFSIIKCNVQKTELLFEYCLTEILLNDRRILVGCFYRSPSNKSTDSEYFISNMDTLLNTLYKANTPTFICGDFNFNFDVSVDDINAKNLCNIFNCYDLHKCITEFTRIQGNSKTIIDNIFSNINVSSLNPKIIYSDLSDHFLQIISYQCILDKVGNNDKPQLKRFFNNTENIIHFKYLLSEVKWNFLTENRDLSCEECFSNFYSTFLELMDKAFPLEYYKTKQKSINCKPWITNDIVNEGIFLRDLYRTFKFTGDEQVYIRYNIMKKNHRYKIKQAKRSYNEFKFLNSNNKSKTAWQIIKNNTYNINSLPKHFTDVEGNNLKTQEETANAFNNFFINSIKHLTDNMSPSLNNIKTINNNNSIFLMPLTTAEMLTIIRSVSAKNSSGEDEVPCSLLLKAAEFIAKPLTYIINLSFIEGTFPSVLKESLIIPVHKKDDKSLISNYRGIALLSAFSKVFEKSYHLRLADFIKQHNLISPYQYGFSKGLSTKDAVLSLYNYVLDNFEKKSMTACLFFDLSRAFDTIDHKLLLDTLERCGIRGTALSWVESYLNGRTQFVAIKGSGKISTSSHLPISTGVPQGSILGPLLFIIFINNIGCNLENVFISLFADDTTVAINSKSIEELSCKANTTVKTMRDYCSSMGLALNNLKTDLILFSTRKIDYSLFVKSDTRTIAQSNNVKFLGVYIDPLLNWGNHIDYVAGKLSTQCFVIWQLRSFININMLKMYYFAHIQSQLSYCIICWGNCSRFNEVFILQKKIIRTMTFKPPQYSCRQLFRELGILTAPSLYILYSVMHIKNNLKHFNSRYDTCVSSGHNLRENYSLNIPHHSLSMSAKSPKIMPIKLFNKLPTYIKRINVIHLFKKEVKSLLQKFSFYSIEEYLQSDFIS